MAAFGIERTCHPLSAMSAFGGKADMADALQCPLLTQSGHEQFRIAAAQTDPPNPILLVVNP